MRLSESEQQTIKDSIFAFDKQAKVVLFGEYGSEEVVDPTGADNGESRVLCGGSSLNGGWNVRSACRSRSGLSL
ncbi:MAG: hypothetical protein ACC651_03885 [Candidatus Scalindua sp.]